MNQSNRDNWERKLGKYAINNISMYMIVCFAIGFCLELIPATSSLVYYLTLEPALILRGQVWRLISWVLIAPRQDIFSLCIACYFYYSIGNTLERIWGTYRYNVYLFSGMFYTIIGAFLMYGLLYGLGYKGASIGSYFTTYYVCMSIFLAFAATFPDMEVLLMFILPIKVKVLGIIYVILMAYSCVSGGLFVAVPIIASLFNFIVFFFTGRKRIGITRIQQRQRKEFRQKVNTAKRQSAVTRHKCAICGRTEESHPNLAFRFCSKCNGNYEFCEDHLFTHKHFE